MTSPDAPGGKSPDSERATNAATGSLLSDEPTVELIFKARTGDRAACEALLQRCLPSLKRWAHGRLPAAARGLLDTGDLVQEAAFSAIRRLDTFEPRHVGAMQAYLRQSVINRIRDEIRKLGTRPVAETLPEELSSSETSPLENVIQQEAYERYRAALEELRPRDRELVVARIEAQWTINEIAEKFGFQSSDAARMAIARAVERLMALIRRDHGSRR
jgi:RNA polymerase sigma factor (sigma-70 family)